MAVYENPLPIFEIITQTTKDRSENDHWNPGHSTHLFLAFLGGEGPLIATSHSPPACGAHDS